MSSWNMSSTEVVAVLRSHVNGSTSWARKLTWTSMGPYPVCLTIFTTLFTLSFVFVRALNSYVQLENVVHGGCSSAEIICERFNVLGKEVNVDINGRISGAACSSCKQEVDECFKQARIGWYHIPIA